MTTLKRRRSNLPIAWIVILFLLTPLVCYGSAYLYSQLYWRYQQADIVRHIKQYAYPAASVINQKVSIDRGQTSDWCVVTVYLTFAT